MKFDAIRGRIKTYEAGEIASEVGTELQKIISRQGIDIFKNINQLNEKIRNSALSCVKKEQLILIFTCSTLPDFAANAKSDLNLVDVDNILHNVINTTGLSYQTALKLITDTLYACGLYFPVEYGPVLSTQSVEYRLHALMPSALAEAETKKVSGMIDSFQKKYATESASKEKETAAAEVTDSIYKLCEAGISDGFYMLACCYLYGECGTAVDESLGLQYLKVAAERGHIKAASKLGAVYYGSDSPFDRSYTLAHHYYTRPGAMAVGNNGQTELEDIYQQKKVIL